MHSISGDDCSQASIDVEWPQDSVSKRRRHALYFHRPPVWRYSSFQGGSSSPSMSEDFNGSETKAAERDSSFSALHLEHQPDHCHAVEHAAPYVTLYDFDSDRETPLLNELSRSELILPDCRNSSVDTVPDFFRQSKPVFCTRLQSYKDVRLELGEQWAIQEGSLVIGLGLEYTLLDSHERGMDEFEVAGGDICVVFSLYADLWALCAKASFNPSPEENDPMQLAFLPLCAVTLAPNYSAFVKRSVKYPYYSASNERKYPGNGLPVIPRRRSHSCDASKQIFGDRDTQISLPLVVHEVF